MPENVAQFGFAAAVGVAVVGYLIWSGKQAQRFLQHLIENHMSANTTALRGVETALDKLAAALERPEKK